MCVYEYAWVGGGVVGGEEKCTVLYNLFCVNFLCMCHSFCVCVAEALLLYFAQVVLEKVVQTGFDF